MSENTGTPGPKPWADQKARHIHRYIATYRQREIGTETETQRERESEQTFSRKRKTEIQTEREEEQEQETMQRAAIRQ